MRTYLNFSSSVTVLWNLLHTEVRASCTILLIGLPRRLVIIFGAWSWKQIESDTETHQLYIPVYDPELTLSTDEAEADLLRFFFLDPPAPILDWPAASRTLVPSIILAPSVVMAAMLSSPWRELKRVKSLHCEKWQKHRWHDNFHGIGKLWFNIKWTSLYVLWWKHSH